MEFVNLTPHAIVLNDGTSFPASGTIARVAVSFSGFDQNGICNQIFGEVKDLPGSVEGMSYVVSGLVLSALKGTRADVVAPATGHVDVKRNEAKQIISVPGFVRG